MRSLLQFQLKGNPWLFLVLKLQTLEPSKKLDLNCHLSTYLDLQGYLYQFFSILIQCSVSKQEKVKDYSWVETQVNLAIGHINVTYDQCNECREFFQQKESHCPLWRVNFSLPGIKQLKHISCWKQTGGNSKVQPRNSSITYILYNGMNSKLEL